MIQRDFNRPDADEWVQAVERAIVSRPGTCVLIGHSLGCITIAKWAMHGSTSRIAGAFLVAPSDLDTLTGLFDVSSFRPMPLDPLPFASTIIASENDPYLSLERGHAFARAWKAEHTNIGCAGHIYTASGHGPWPEGLSLFAAFVERLETAEKP